MLNKRLPFNITLLKLDPGKIKLMTPVTSLDIYDSPGSSDFHDEGLFSTKIFGRVGEDRRDQQFSYIPLKTKILHPIIFQRLERLKRLYGEILAGTKTAKWDDQLKDFVNDTDHTGDTGYEFFMSHWHEIKFRRGDSEIRNQRVDLIEKYRDKAVISEVLVMPAGLRDAEIDTLGRTRKDEINEHYQRLISISNTISDTSRNDVSVLDRARYAQQKALNEIYFTIERLLSGKGGFIQSKWGSRIVTHGTRNVITAMEMSTEDLESKYHPDADSTAMGLWQVSKGATPITIPRLRQFIIGDVFGDAEGAVRLIHPKTLELEFVEISSQEYDKWTTTDGLEKVISSQSTVELRAMPVMIDGYYLAMVYKPKDRKVFKVFTDINELPEGFDRKDCHPITLHELIYLCNYRGWNKLGVITTRYPVTGEGSTYPAKVFVRTTVNSEPRVELDYNWEPMESDGNTATVYPIFEPESYIDSAMVHSSRLGGLGGDFDGDTVSNNIVFSEEAIAEIDQMLMSREAHVDPAGGLRASMSIDTIDLVMNNLTG